MLHILKGLQKNEQLDIKTIYLKRLWGLQQYKNNIFTAYLNLDTMNLFESIIFLI